MPHTLLTHFADLLDPGVERMQRHLLLDILMVALCALICVAGDFVAVSLFSQAKEGWLRERLAI